MATYELRTFGHRGNGHRSLMKGIEGTPSEALRSYRLLKDLKSIINSVYAGDPPPADLDVESLVLVKIDGAEQQVLLRHVYDQEPNEEELQAIEEEEDGILAPFGSLSDYGNHYLGGIQRGSCSIEAGPFITPQADRNEEAAA